MISTIDFVNKLIETANGYVGEDRANDEPQIAKFLALLDLPFSENGTNVPFCAAFVSYCACKSYCELAGIQFTPENSVEIFKSVIPDVKLHFFLPSASCNSIKQDAIARGIWVSASIPHSEIKKGWLVIYDFANNDWADHVGIVELAEDNLHTVEGNTTDSDNTNGGAIANKIRGYSNVNGFIRTC